jgi:cytochrome c553
VESPEKRFWTDTAWDNGTGTQAPGMTWDDFNNKRILGTVDVEADGSVYFEVPADTFLYLQLLDENGMMVQSMRSGMTARPGEMNGCVGCHENRLATFPSVPQTPQAMMKPPQKLRPWYGKPRLFSYVTEVQPVFDKYCVTCHDYGKVEGTQKPNLAGDLNMLFNTSYVELRGKRLVVVPGAGPHEKLAPYTWGSHKSRLADVLLKGHADPKIDARRKELGLYVDQKSDLGAIDRVLTWIDINAPYFPTYASAYPANRYGRSPLDNAALQRLEQLCGTGDLKWAVSFDRPEVSPCLAKWSTPEQKQSAEYREALAIIKQGRSALAKTSRGEDPNFEPVIAREQSQQQKYDRLREMERRMREAILAGNRLFDPVFQ